MDAKESFIVMLTEVKKILTVSQLNRFAREVIEESFSSIWVEGEISNLSKPSSGHIYFSLKDQNAQIRCAFFRQKGQFLNFNLANGSQVLLQACVSIYETRGDFQLIVEYIEEAGNGKLRRAFELLKEKLAEEGLFNSAFKKKLPSLARRIGIITSASGAAVRDILTILKRRFPAIPVIIYPTQVQGTAATQQIADAIELANQQATCDVLILTRGGGSLEDLWCFNEEMVARAIFKSQIPIISAVGHEIDFTIADFVADLRAPTPSAAAELVTPNQTEWFENYKRIQQNLIYLINSKLQQHQHHLKHLQKRLRSPLDILREQMQVIDFIEQSLSRMLLHQIQTKEIYLQKLFLALHQQSPAQYLAVKITEITAIFTRLSTLLQQKLENSQYQLNHLARALDAVSPLATLDRGYAILFDEDNKVIASVNEVSLGKKIKARLKDGNLVCRVDEVKLN